MLFNSLQFAIFLPVVWLIYWRLDARRQLVCLFVASYIFYGLWDVRFLALLGVSTIVDFTVGRALAATEDGHRRKRLLQASIATNLGILGFFKYFNFFVAEAQDLLDSVGLGTDPILLRIVLPVGISFYTFQTMSYTIDIYRRRLEPTDDLLAFAVYVAYFPQLVAGPIERASRLLPKLTGPRHYPSRERITSGVSLIALGLFKKVVVGDIMANKVDEVFSNPSTFGWLSILIGIYAFLLQIYADFSGYSDIARGTSRLLGIELVRNFEQPYLSRSFAEFWTRWHISLSDWLRDYLYIPIGGNRGGWFRASRSVMVTMVLGGLWHGAGWTYIIWGALHGSYLVIERLVRKPPPADAPLRTAHIPGILLTFHLHAFSLVFFRSPNLAGSWELIKGLVTLRPGSIRAETLPLVIVFGAVMLALDLAQRRTGSHVPWVPTSRSVPVGAMAALAVGLIVMSAGAAQVPFIYFQF